jgi:hypothetical protein
MQEVVVAVFGVELAEAVVRPLAEQEVQQPADLMHHQQTGALVVVVPLMQTVEVEVEVVVL